MLANYKKLLIKKEKNMKNKLLKPALALALALSVVTPSVKTSFAADTSVSENELETIKKEYESVYIATKEKYGNLLKAKYDPKYINEKDPDKKYLFDKSLTILKETLDSYSPGNVNSFVLENEYQTAIRKIRSDLTYAEAKYKDLSGVAADTSKLNSLVNDTSNFTASFAYKNASQSQRDAFDEAYANAENILENSVRVTQEECDQAFHALNNIYNKIEKAESERINNAKEALEAEIKEAYKVDKASYTEKSYLVFKKALVAAQTTANSTNSTKEQYQTSLDALKAAKDSLVKVDSEKDKELKALIVELKKSLEQHKIQAQALRYLLETKPKTIQSVKPKLEQLLKESDALVKETQQFLDEVENVQG